MISGLCRSALELGAVSGAFTPGAMADALGLDPAQRGRLWRELSAHVVEVLGSPMDDPADGAPYGWMLTPDARLGRFEGFVSRSGLDRLLDAAPAPRPGDDFGDALRRLLAGEAVSLDPQHRVAKGDGLLAAMRRAGAILEAVQLVRHVAPLDTASHGALEVAAKRRIQDLQRRRDLFLVLPHRHRGYEAERRRLSLFMRGRTGSARPVFLSGMGGAGKSALLARMFGYWQRRSDSPLTVTIDFDRRQLVSGEPVEILKEMFRQCATGIEHKLDDPDAVRAVTEGLNALRRDLPERGAAGRERSFDSQIGWLHTATLRALRQDWAAPLRALPIAMNFDSFEAVDRRGGGTLDLIFDLEAMLREYLPHLRTVVSGRARLPDEGAMERYFGDADRSVHLAGIGEKAGIALLADADERQAGPTGTRHLKAGMRRRLTRALKGHPLALLMVVRFAHTHPGEIGELVDDLGTDSGFQVEFAQTFLYERILGRIDDPTVRRLAHPGLILRAVNDDLIRLVLAEPCLDRAVDGDEAAALRAGLAHEYWLVEAGDDDFPLRHRPDLRRLMVPGLLAVPRGGDSAGQRAAKADLTAKARAICTAAAAWFADGPPEDDPGRARWRRLSPSMRAAHDYYYRGLAGEAAVPALTRAGAQNVWQELGDDLDTLPAAWRAPVRVLIGAQVDAAERATLDGELRDRAEAAIYDAERVTGRGGAVEPEGRDAPSLSQMERMISTAFAGADFDTVAGLADRYAAMLADDGPETLAERLRKARRGGLLHSPLWQSLLAVRATGGREHAVDGILAGYDLSSDDDGSAPFHHPVDRLRCKRGRAVGEEEITDEREFFDMASADLSDGPADIAFVLRGLNPDLYEPLETCLREAKRETVHAVLAEIAETTPRWPTDLRFDDARPFHPRQAPTVVEIADELGRLDRLAALLGRTDARAWTVLKMYDFITDRFFADLPLERETG